MVGDRLEQDVWRVTANDTGARYAIRLTAMVELASGDQIELVGECVELLYPAGPLVRVDWLRKFAPDMD